MLNDCVHLSTVDLSDAAGDDNICKEASHDCNVPVKDRQHKLPLHWKILCDLKCGNSWELIGGTLHDKGKVMQHKLHKVLHFQSKTLLVVVLASKSRASLAVQQTVDERRRKEKLHILKILAVL